MSSEHRPPAPDARLESWKAIAAFLNRDVRTVRYAYPVTTSSPWREFRLLPPFLPDATAPDTRAQRQAPAARQD